MVGKLKIGKRIKFPMLLLGVIALVAIIVANIIVWRNYSDKQAQVETLTAEVQQVNQKISQAAQPPSDLESKLETAKGDLAKASLIFPTNVDRNDVVEFILSTAEECQVQLVPLMAELGASGSTGQPYNMLRYSGTVSGSLIQVSSFMTRLHNDKYPTMIITECTVQRTSAKDVTIPNSDIGVTVNFSVTLYTA
jgi:hypothetical protein